MENLQYIYKNDFYIDQGTKFLVKSVSSYFNKNKVFEIDNYLAQGKYSFVYTLKNTDSVIKIIPLNVYMLEDDCKWEDPFLQENLPNGYCGFPTTKKDFEKELKFAIKAGLYNIGPKILYYNIFDLIINNKNVNVGVIVMEKMQYTLTEYYKLIRQLTNFESLLNTARKLTIQQNIKAWKVNIYVGDLHWDNIMVNIDEHFKITSLKFVDFGILTTFENYLTHYMSNDFNQWQQILENELQNE